MTYTPFAVDNGLCFALGSDGKVYAWTSNPMSGAFGWTYYAG